MGRKPIVRHETDVGLLTETCGGSRRIITAQGGTKSSLHVVSIVDSKLHYHVKTEEIYYVIAGWGYMNIDGEDYEVRPGTTIHIPPGQCTVVGATL